MNNYLTNIIDMRLKDPQCLSHKINFVKVDIKNSWYNALMKNDFQKEAEDIKRIPKKDRNIYIAKASEIHQRDLIQIIESEWSNWNRDFCNINNIDITKNILRFFYDGIYLKNIEEKNLILKLKDVEYKIEKEKTIPLRLF